MVVVFVGVSAESVLLRTCKHGGWDGALNGELSILSKELGEQIDFA